jgi:hypothetical protein
MFHVKRMLAAGFPAVLTRDSSRHSHQRVAQSRRDPCASCMSAGGSSQDARRTGSPHHESPDSEIHPPSNIDRVRGTGPIRGTRAHSAAHPVHRPGNQTRSGGWISIRRTDVSRETVGMSPCQAQRPQVLPSAHAPEPSTHVGEPATSQRCTPTRCVEGPSQPRVPSPSTSSISMFHVKHHPPRKASSRSPPSRSM